MYVAVEHGVGVDPRGGLVSVDEHGNLPAGCAEDQEFIAAARCRIGDEGRVVFLRPVRLEQPFDGKGVSGHGVEGRGFGELIDHHAFVQTQQTEGRVVAPDHVGPATTFDCIFATPPEDRVSEVLADDFLVREGPNDAGRLGRAGGDHFFGSVGQDRGIARIPNLLEYIAVAIRPRQQDASVRCQAQFRVDGIPGSDHFEHLFADHGTRRIEAGAHDMI